MAKAKNKLKSKFKASTVRLVEEDDEDGDDEDEDDEDDEDDDGETEDVDGFRDDDENDESDRKDTAAKESVGSGAAPEQLLVVEILKRVQTLLAQPHLAIPVATVIIPVADLMPLAAVLEAATWVTATCVGAA